MFLLHLTVLYSLMFNFKWSMSWLHIDVYNSMIIFQAKFLDAFRRSNLKSYTNELVSSLDNPERIDAS